MTDGEVEAILAELQPPADLFGQMARQRDGFTKTSVLVFKKISRAEAAWEGYRRRHDPDEPPALLWCSSCEEYGVVDWEKERDAAKEACGRAWMRQPKRGIRIRGEEGEDPDGLHWEYDTVRCPWCGEKAMMLHSKDVDRGRCEQLIATVPYVVRGELLLVQWWMEARVAPTGGGWNNTLTVLPCRAWLVEERGVRVWAKMQRRFGSCCERLDAWTKRKYNGDTLGTPYFYTKQPPSLAGTWLENSKLWTYMRETYDEQLFAPLCYLALYRAHRNTEVLVTSGCGRLLGRWLKNESQTTNYVSDAERWRKPKLAWVRWKERRPSAMLGLDRQQLRECLAAKCGDDIKSLYIRLGAREGLRIDECVAMEKVYGCYTLREMLEQYDGGTVKKIARYLKKQRCSWHTLRDYWNMQQQLGVDVDADEALRWPPRLQQAHDRAQDAVRYERDKHKEAAFDAMTARLQGLCWERDGICIRPAESIRELVEEGKVLRHCVGGYGNAHSAGKCIFFIRHTRRPERSWYTLQVDVRAKIVLQNHGYRNENLGGGKARKIPQEVQAFVAAWQREVLAGWKLPPEKTDRQKKDKARENAGHAA